MTDFNKAVRAAEAAHGVCLKALDRAFHRLIEEVGASGTTDISIVSRGKEATGHVLIHDKWIPVKIQVGTTDVRVEVDNGVFTKPKTTLVSLNDVYKAEEILRHCAVVLDAANEGFLSVT